ncbi:Ribosome-recycling factor [Candidatus Kinetoplastibacterium sorsogonicusi]|uniref:Ribosome-recycling factor n=1 Tax=Candidatus Kinetoplastidibacterium kentomonadis TaxID=1576550 RepID=A0A3S7J9S3_9PROT|nr:ribosome recycling factor [Candidatus Kinetoplastibacterium sorsogonicusi]AWD32427.1 Ribosome-recycling factor [Candidatus Kinetoplastibacterium sorsogonicusi]
MLINELYKSTNERMLKSIENLNINLMKIRTGRAHVGILDHINVSYYGSNVPIKQLASLNLLDSRTIAIQPYEKNILSTIEKSIRESDLGVNPINLGNMIKVPMPSLTEERRRDLVKLVKIEAEDTKISIRNLRRNANESLKKYLKDKLISEDEERRSQEDIQKLTNNHISEVDKIIIKKEREIMTI